MWKTTHFLAIFFKMAGGLAEHITLLLPDIAASRPSKKTSVFFGSYSCSTLKKK